MTIQVKNAVTISLTIFVIIIVAILGAGVFINQGKTSTTPIVQQNNNANTITTIALADVAKHNAADDCWIIVSNKVYNATSLIPIHTGGPEQIISYCGKDATTAFNTKDGRGAHSQRAQDILNNYYVGDITR